MGLSPKIQVLIEPTVTITQPSADQIDVSFVTTEGFVQKALKSDDFYCEDGTLWIKAGRVNHADGMGFARHDYLMGLRKAIDGSLVGRHQDFVLGLAMWIIPIGGTQVLWYKWSPAN